MNAYNSSTCPMNQVLNILILPSNFMLYIQDIYNFCTSQRWYHLISLDTYKDEICGNYYFENITGLKDLLKNSLILIRIFILLPPFHDFSSNFNWTSKNTCNYKQSCQAIFSNPNKVNEYESIFEIPGYHISTIPAEFQWSSLCTHLIPTIVNHWRSSMKVWHMQKHVYL